MARPVLTSPTEPKLMATYFGLRNTSPQVKAALAVLTNDIERPRTESRDSLQGRGAEVNRALQLRHNRPWNRHIPICKLPHELLSIIFMLAKAMELADLDADDDSDSEVDAAENSHESYDDDDDDMVQDLSVTPLEITVTHVCSRFRDVATATHALWASIVVAPAQPLSKIAAYIARSDVCPLTVRIDFSDLFRPSPGALQKMSAVLSQSHRFRHLSIVSAYEELVGPAILHLYERGAPVLESLSLCISDLHNTKMIAAGPRVLTDRAPKLSFVRLRGFAMFLFQPPMGFLATFHLDHTRHLPVDYATFRRFVTASPFLENLSIYGDVVSWPLTNSRLDLAALRSLRICGIGGLVYSGLLLGINAPQLESLVLKDVQEHDLDSFWESPDVLKFPLLHSLTLQEASLSSAAYAHIFRAFPYVTTFSALSWVSSTPMILKLLARTIDTPWPRLHTLSYLWDVDDDSLLLKIIEQRQDTLLTLRLGKADQLSLTEHYARKGKVTVERLRMIDPFGAGYDEDDNLFY